jgi:methyl-accepting chemotaxis protein
VVANEVKELARGTAKATEDIGKKIEAIQHDTSGAVAAIGQISSIIWQVSELQSSIAASVEQQVATSAEIGRNVSEAARLSGEIAHNAATVASSAEAAAAGAADSQNAATELARLAAELVAPAPADRPSTPSGGTRLRLVGSTDG